MRRTSNVQRRTLSLVLPLLLITVLSPSEAAAQDVPQFDAGRSFRFLEEQCALGPRNPGSPGHRDGLQYILDIITPLADSVLTQPFPYSDPYSGSMIKLTNVVAQFNPELNHRLWVAAHWDTRPWADREKREENRIRPILGANDGASGVAVLLELAHHFHESSPPRGIDLLFLDGEDMGRRGDLDHFFNGSRHLARNIPTRMPEYCILIDMVGDKNLNLPVELNSWRQAPELVGRLWNLAARLALTPFEWRMGYAVDDDHVIIFEVGGIPSVDIIDFEYPGKSNSLWHTLGDTPDKCSPESLKTVGTLLLHHIYEEN